jgi:hypothetical protein
VSALVVVLVCLAGALGCEQPSFDTSGGGMASGGGLVLAGSSSGAAPAAGGEGALPFGCHEYPVEALAAGAPSVDQEICTATSEPVLANGAAQIRLVLTNGDPREPTTGILAFPEELRGHVNGEPIIGVDRTVANLSGVVSSVQETDDGYSFSVVFGPDALLIANDQTRVSLRATFDYRCDGGSRLVSAVTELRLCGGNPTPVTWSAPGDTCVVCNEYQPSPKP